MNSEDIFARIIETYNSLTRSEALLADYIMKNRHQIQSTTVSSLADACHVSCATVTRFCRSIGCASFNDFKFEVAQTVFADSVRTSESDAEENDLYGEIRADDSIEQKCQKLYSISKQALSQTFAQLDTKTIAQAVKLLTEADNVFCFGQGNSTIVAMDAWGRFASVTPKFHWVPDAHLQAATAAILGPRDVVLYFSFSGATRELSEVGRLLKSTEAKLVLITRFPNSPGASDADLLLICGANESARQQGSIAAKISQLFIIDVLYNEFCACNPETSRVNRENSIAAMRHMML